MLHVDGAEFYSNSEYIVYSLGSVLAEGSTEIWDSKFPICCIPHEAMIDAEVASFQCIMFGVSTNPIHSTFFWQDFS